MANNVQVATSSAVLKKDFKGEPLCPIVWKVETVDSDTKQFRSAPGCFPAGPAIITAASPDGTPVGLTCKPFTSVSLAPQLVAWSLHLASKSLEAFQGAVGFTINAIREDQAELSVRFASSSNATKFEGVTYVTGHLGSPVIEDCVANFQCETFAQHLAGDHVIFIDHVQAFERGGQESSLVFYRGACMALTQSLRELSASGRIPLGQIEEAIGDCFTTCCCVLPVNRGRRLISSHWRKTSGSWRCAGFLDRSKRGTPV